MINNVFLLGRIAHDLEYTVDDNDLARCTFKLAVERYKGNTDYPTITVFGERAKNLVKYNNKGELLHISGYINTNRRKKEEGSYQYFENIVAESIKYLSPKSKEDNKGIENHRNDDEKDTKQDVSEVFNNNPQNNEDKEKAEGFQDKPLPF